LGTLPLLLADRLRWVLSGYAAVLKSCEFRKVIQERWSYQVADMDRRLVAFKDESDGQNPMHQYRTGRDYTTILEVEGPGGKSRLANVWGVSVK
jgi:hypothetical protein